MMHASPSSIPSAIRTSGCPHLKRLLDGLGKVWQAGVPVEWAAVYEKEGRRRVPLPTYPFERQRHWVDAPPLVARTAGSSAAAGIARSVGRSPTEAVIDSTLPGSGSDDRTTLGGGPAAAAATTTPGPKESEAPPPDSAGRDETIADRLVAFIADLSGLDGAAMERTANFTDLGFDSLFLTEFNMLLRRHLGVRVKLGQLLDETPTIDSLAAYIERELGAPPPTTAGDGRPTDEAAGTGDTRHPTPHPTRTARDAIPLLPNIARFMRERDTPHAEHWNLGVLVEPADRLEPETTRRVVAALLERHDALRLRIAPDDGGYRSSITPVTDALPFATTDLSGLDSDCTAGRGRAARRRAAGEPRPGQRSAHPRRAVRPRRTGTAAARGRPPLRTGPAVVAAVLGGLPRAVRRVRAGDHRGTTTTGDLVRGLGAGPPAARRFGGAAVRDATSGAPALGARRGRSPSTIPAGPTPTPRQSSVEMRLHARGDDRAAAPHHGRRPQGRPHPRRRWRAPSPSGPGPTPCSST